MPPVLPQAGRQAGVWLGAPRCDVDAACMHTSMTQSSAFPRLAAVKYSIRFAALLAASKHSTLRCRAGALLLMPCRGCHANMQG